MKNTAAAPSTSSPDCFLMDPPVCRALGHVHHGLGPILDTELDARAAELADAKASGDAVWHAAAANAYRETYALRESIR